MTEDREREEWESGRINFEENVRHLLQRATDHYQNGNFLKHNLTLQKIWDTIFREDQKAIMKLVKERQDENPTNTEMRSPYSRILNAQMFLRYVTADPTKHTSKFALSKKNRWREIHNLMGEGLKRRYPGKRRHWEERHEE